MGNGSRSENNFLRQKIRFPPPVLSGSGSRGIVSGGYLLNHPHPQRSMSNIGVPGNEIKLILISEDNYV